MCGGKASLGEVTKLSRGIRQGQKEHVGHLQVRTSRINPASTAGFLSERVMSFANEFLIRLEPRYKNTYEKGSADRQMYKTSISSRLAPNAKSVR